MCCFRNILGAFGISQYTNYFSALVKCRSEFEVGFVIDSSASLFRDYQKEKEFVKNFVSLFEITKAGNRAGAVIFSDRAELMMKLSDFVSSQSFNRAVDDLPLLGGTTRIDMGLKKAFSDLFSVDNGMRPRASKLLVLLTDGKQSPDSDIASPYEAMRPFHEEGIKVIVIGIGPKVDKDELMSLVTDRKHFYHAKDFDELLSKGFMKNLTFDSCKKPGKFFQRINANKNLSKQNQFTFKVLRKKIAVQEYIPTS